MADIATHPDYCFPRVTMRDDSIRFRGHGRALPISLEGVAETSSVPLTTLRVLVPHSQTIVLPALCNECYVA